MFEHFETIVPYGRKDCGGSLYGLHHEIHYAFEHMLHMSHKDIMDWLWHHQLPEKVLLADACSYLVAHGCYYSRLATDGSLGAALLKYYTPEELTEKWSVYGVTVRVQTQDILRTIRESFNSKTQYYQWIRELKSRIPDRSIRDIISAFLQRCEGFPYKEGGRQRYSLLSSLPMEGELTHWVCTQMSD